MPTASAETPGRVRSRVIIASLKPWFSSPSMFSAGTSTSSKEIVAVFGGALAELVLLLVDRDAVGVAVDDEGGDPAVAGLGVGLGVDRVPGRRGRRW